jgi:hypothetical protein
MIDGKCLVTSWQSEGLNDTVIHVKHVTWFCEKAPTYSSVTNWLRCLHFGEDILEPGIHTAKSSDDLVDFKLLTELTHFLIRSVQTLAARSRSRGPRYGMT